MSNELASLCVFRNHLKYLPLIPITAKLQAKSTSNNAGQNPIPSFVVKNDQLEMY
jgi:hypothetical protein